MREIERKPARAAFFGTIAVWLFIIFFFSIYSLFFMEKPYRTIQIRLDEPLSQKEISGVEKSDVSELADSHQFQTSAVAPQTAQSLDSAKSAQPTVQPKKDSKGRKPEKKLEASENQMNKTVQKESPKPVEQVLQADVMEAFNKNTVAKTSKKEFDWSQFDDSSSVTPLASSKNVTQPSSQSSFSGSAAQAVSEASSSQSSVSSSKSEKSGNVSGETADRLKELSDVRGGTVAGVESASSKSGTATGTKSASAGNGQNTVSMSDGSFRSLISPKTLEITLSESAASKIDAGTKVPLTFVINADGSVPLSGIKIPETFPTEVKNEIRKQISEWRFSSAASSGTATFIYTIEKK